MKTLFIDGAHRPKVMLGQKSLRIAVFDRADRLFYFRHIGTVVAFGKVEWEIGALLACLDAGIPVALMTHEGRLRGYCLPQGPRRRLLEQRWEVFFGQPDWQAHYDAWRHSAERRTVLAILDQLGIQACDSRPGRLRRLLVGHLAPPLEPAWVFAALRFFHGLYASRLIGHFPRIGLSPAVLFEYRAGRDFVADLTRIGGWHAFLWLGDLASRVGEVPPQPASMAYRRMLTEFFESHSVEVNESLRFLLADFVNLIGGMA